ncbi:flagellar hook assembly protein FlgD [Devosia sp.]|uniref:flagellar hook assembly protein FlgD n=1 Tax=Devosia sp. TaxID=1871048 RepID=UPI0035AF1EE7
MAVSAVGSTSTSSLSGTRATIAQNFDTFLQLLTTQLRNQNPLDPLDTNQFTQQLVQFSGVEQQLKTNDFLEAMMLSTQNANNSQAVSYIGKMVTASGVRTELADGAATWHFAVDKDASITATVKDADGNTVFTKAGTVKKGESVFNWDGIGTDGKQKPDGTYSVQIEARDSEGNLVSVATEMTGEVTGIDFSGSEPVLIVGGARVNLSSVLSVRSKTATDATSEEGTL